MSGVFWKDGRFGWPLFCLVVYGCGSLLAADYVWRLVQMPFETLLIDLFAANVATIALISAAYLLFRRKRTRKAQASKT